MDPQVRLLARLHNAAPLRLFVPSPSKASLQSASTRSARTGVVTALLALVSGAGCGPIDSFQPVTPQGSAIAGLWWWTLFPSLFVFLLVSGIVAVIVVRDRARPAGGEPPQTGGNRRLEIVWTVGPALTLAVFLVLVWQTMSAVNAESESQLRVRVIGHQWWWEYEYPDLGVTTANELHLPVGQSAVLELEGADVIHSFWVPQFGWKRDTIPGRVNRLPVRVDAAGTYDGACAEYCGSQHAWMRIRVVAEPPEQFQTWVRAQQQPAPGAGDASARGQQVFLRTTCVNCHAVAGTPASARIGPDLSHLGSRSILGAGVIENTPESLVRWIRDPRAIKPGVLMPGYAELTEDDLRVLADYLWGLK